MKILVLKRDKIGDMLLMTPMLRHLRASRPDAQIHVLANDYNAWVVEGNPNIDRLWVYPRARHGAEFRPSAVLAQLRQLWQLRRQRYDFAIAAGGVVSPRAIRRALRVGAARTVAYCRGEECRGLSDPLTLPARIHEVEANLNLLSPLGVAPPDRVIYPEYAPTDAWLDFGRRWVADRGLRRTRPQCAAGQAQAHPGPDPPLVGSVQGALGPGHRADVATGRMGRPGIPR